MDFTGKVGLVTGGGSGIGRATSALFAERGGAVLVADINEAGAKATVEAIIRKGGRAEACRVDVARWEDVKATVDRARRAFGRHAHERGTIRPEHRLLRPAGRPGQLRRDPARPLDRRDDRGRVAGIAGHQPHRCFPADQGGHGGDARTGRRGDRLDRVPDGYPGQGGSCCLRRLQGGYPAAHADGRTGGGTAQDPGELRLSRLRGFAHDPEFRRAGRCRSPVCRVGQSMPLGSCRPPRGRGQGYAVSRIR